MMVGSWCWQRMLQMGNIELEDQNRRKPIFVQHRHNQPSHDPLKYSPIRSQRADHLDTHRHRHPLPAYSPSKHNRVGDFKDFLNEIKMHMQQHSEDVSPQDNQPGGRNQKQSSQELVLKFRLENEKLELEKYRRLVERELSKSHSIEEIRLEGSEHDKKLTIHFEEMPQPHLQRGTIAHNPPRKGLAGQAWLAGQSPEIAQQKNRQRELIDEARRQYQELTGRTELLDQLMTQHEQKQARRQSTWNQERLFMEGYEVQAVSAEKAKEGEGGREEDRLQEVEDGKERVSRISGLFQDLSQLQEGQQSIEQEIKAALELRPFDSESDCSASFAEVGLGM